MRTAGDASRRHVHGELPCTRHRLALASLAKHSFALGTSVSFWQSSQLGGQVWSKASSLWRHHPHSEHCPLREQYWAMVHPPCPPASVHSTRAESASAVMGAVVPAPRESRTASSGCLVTPPFDTHAIDTTTKNITCAPRPHLRCSMALVAISRLPCMDDRNRQCARMNACATVPMSLLQRASVRSN